MFKQKLSLIVSVFSMEKKIVKSEKNGKSYVVLDTKAKTVPEGVFVGISKMFELKDDMNSFIQGKIDEFESLINIFNAEKEAKREYYGYISVKPKASKENKKVMIMWDKLKVETTEEGKEYFKLESWFNPLKSEVDEIDGDTTFIFVNNTTGSTKKVKKSTVKPNVIEVDMLLVEQNENKVILNSGGDFPVEVVAYFPDDVEVKEGVIGQGYRFLLGFEKGLFVKGNEEDEGSYGWDEEIDASEDTSGGFASDRLIITGLAGKVNGYSLDEDGNAGDEYTY